jgi:hypothetical protein
MYVRIFPRQDTLMAGIGGVLLFFVKSKNVQAVS